MTASAAVRTLVSSTVEDPRDEITSLRKQQRELVQKKKTLAKDLKNAQRRTRRVQGRAKTLSDEDLLSVLRMRAERRGAEPAGGSCNAKKTNTTTTAAACDITKTKTGVDNANAEDEQDADQQLEEATHQQ